MPPDAPTTDDRLLNAIRSIIRAEFPQLTYACSYEYAIQAVTGTGISATIDASPTDTTIPIPFVAGCPLAPVVGATCTPTIGTLCWIMFMNADPTRPVCISLDAGPTAMVLANGTLAAARFTDAVVVGGFGGTITGGSSKVKVG